MTWETFYKKFNDWTGITQLRHISSITNFGATQEICEIAEACINKKTANKLICRAMVSGVEFTPSELARLESLVDKNLYGELAKICGFHKVV